MLEEKEDIAKGAALDTIEELVRAHWGKLLACLISQLGDFQLAEDSLQDGLVSAIFHWPRNGTPRSPQAWLLQTARRKAIDRLRRKANFQSKQAEYQYLLELDHEDSMAEEFHEIPDERLRLIFTCCHPALDEKTRTALTLKTLGGLKTSEIARAFLDSEEAMAQRLVRAKRKIRIAAIPYKIPENDEWADRLQTVLNVIYLIFNEGYFSSHGASQIRTGLCDEALRLAQLLRTLIPAEPEIEGLFALINLNYSRINARYNHLGEMVSLENQGRDKWDQGQIIIGIDALENVLAMAKPGQYQIQAAISAIHSQSKSHETTDWHEIVLLYDALFTFTQNPVVKLNRAVALSYSQGAIKALDCLVELEKSMRDYQPFHAAKADFLHRIKHIKAAEASYRHAIALSLEPDTRVFLEKKLGQMLLG